MFYTGVSLFCILLAVVTATDSSNPHSITGYNPEVTVYRLRTNKPGEMLGDHRAVEMAESLEELIMARDSEREFLMFSEKKNFEEEVGRVPYYETSREDLCAENNGNCSQRCETVGSQTVCSCGEGYTLTNDTACSDSSACDYVLSGTSGSFSIAKNNCQWMIKAPNRYLIKIRLHLWSVYEKRDLWSVYEERDIGKIYDGNSTSANMISIISTKNGWNGFTKLSSGQYLLIKTYDGWDVDSYGAHASYETGYRYLEMRGGYDSGYLRVPISPLSVGGDCFSLTYTQHSSLTISLDEKYGTQLQTLLPEFTFQHPDGRWKRDIFRIPFHQEAESVTLRFHGRNTKVYNVARCLNFELHAAGGQQFLGRTVCRNGGVWNNSIESCICPPGFVGNYCEEGCGSNGYGQNCSTPCSVPSSACEGMIFCTQESCWCASEQQGENCVIQLHEAGEQQFLGRTVCRNGGVWNNSTESCICPPGFFGNYCEEGRTVCRNGGVWNNSAESCICPQGFVGNYCEEGCGPNRYGQNCSTPCSFLSTGCEGMIFCTEESCSCAPGLQGANCDSLCNPGNYGASCRQHCGKCRNDEACDQYTGVCYSGCSDGFRPPFCQQTCKVLANAPEIVAVNYTSLKIRISFENLTGEGEPIFYEVQHKEEKENIWSKSHGRIIPSQTELGTVEEFEIRGLVAGEEYETRVILIDKDGCSYQTDVPKSKARTKCNDPPQGEYKFAAKDVRATRVLLEWFYEHDKTSLSCEIVEFELSVLCGSEHLKLLITQTIRWKAIDVMPDITCKFRLVGKTVLGGSTPPAEIEVHTPPAAPRRVRAVKAEPMVSGTGLKVSWLPPWNSEGESLRYKVTYQCVYLLACDGTNCDTSSGEDEVSATSVVLGSLQPHALYQVEIASVSPGGLVSESYMITALTAHTAPHVAPSAAENPILAVTNTSVSLSWIPPEDCSALNGYFYGYSYSLVEKDTRDIIQEGTVPENFPSVNFSDLMPSHCYDAYITVVTSGGSSLSDQLMIPFCTTTTGRN